MPVLPFEGEFPDADYVLGYTRFFTSRKATVFLKSSQNSRISAIRIAGPQEIRITEPAIRSSYPIAVITRELRLRLDEQADP